jgi:hypothetical protein
VDPTERFDQIAHMLQEHLGNPNKAATNLRAHLNFLPPAHADAVTANTMNKLQTAAHELPIPRGPATAFGIQNHVNDRDKREYLRKFDAKFDVFGAIKSGRKDLILEAEKYHPEMMNEIRKKAIAKLGGEDVDYLTKRRVSGILGIPGTPTQDPRLANGLQLLIQTRKTAQDSQGQMKSARQMNANLKNNSATLTRAQRILNGGD